MDTERRVEKRLPIALRLNLGASECVVTRNLTFAGLYVRCDGAYEIGATLPIECDFAEVAPLVFRANARVIRIVRLSDGMELALRLSEQVLLPVAP